MRKANFDLRTMLLLIFEIATCPLNIIVIKYRFFLKYLVNSKHFFTVQYFSFFLLYLYITVSL